MPVRIRWFLLLAVGAWLLPGSPSLAQVKEPVTVPPAAAAGESPAPATPPLVQEIKPETYYLRDQDGRLVPVPNFPYEEFQRLLQLDVESGPAGVELPSYALQELTISGTASATRAELTATVTLRLLQTGWVRVPLRLTEAILRRPPSYQGGGELFVTCDHDAGGYVCWIRGPQDKTHQISLQLVVPVREVGNELRLTLQPPRATSSAMDLRVPIPDALATANSGLLEIKKAGVETQFLVTGVAGDFQLAWTKGAAPPVETRPVLRADLRSTIRVDGVREVNGDVRLTVTSLRGEIESFNVRLPPGTRMFLTQPNQAGYRLTEIAGTEESQGTLVQVKLDRPKAEPVEIQLLTEITPTGNGKTPEFEAGGVEVEDAIRQTTVLDVVVDGDLAVTWKPGPNVQRTAPPEASRNTIAARFESFRRSHSLRIQVAPQETQISVEPLYMLQVEPNRVRLTATLKYKVRGTPAYGVNIQLPNWRVEQIGPDALVDADALDREKREPLQIPLRAAAVPESGEFTLQLDAIQEIAERSGAVSITLPRPEAKASTRAVVAVLPADNLELTIADSELQGLEKEPFPPQIELPVRQQTPLFFRERSDVKSAVLGAALRLRARAVSVASRIRLEVDGPQLHVRQQLDYRVAYEPLRALEVLVPRAVLDSETLKILHAEQALPFVEVTAADRPREPGQAGAAADLSARVQVDLLADRIGPLDVLLLYDLPAPAPSLTGTSPARVPVAAPVAGADTVLTTSRLEIDPGLDAQVQLPGEGWERDEPSGQTEARETYLSRSFPSVVDLLITRLDRRRKTSTAVLQAWLQTWLGPTRRRDRAVFRVLTDEDRIQVRPADGAQIEHVMLDARRVSLGKNAASWTEIALPRNSAPREHVVEIWQSSPWRQSSVVRTALQSPRIQGTSWTKRVYWEVVLPADQCLLWPPAGLTPEMKWQRHGLWVERRPTLDASELEQWIGASHQEAPSASLPRYLFSGFGDVESLDMAVSRRWAIVLLLSGGALGCGLLLIYFPVCRHPAVLFFGGVAALAAMVAAPDLAVATAQASLLGLILGLLAWALKGFVDYRELRRTVVRGARLASPESKTARAAALTAPRVDSAMPVPSTTATAPAEFPIGEPTP
ncbi:MAG: hypothetical protein MUF25_03270 [Pirellulaceae bacterium]|nr:hypothetical protein [Pirellulaceae bacterium]